MPGRRLRFGKFLVPEQRCKGHFYLKGNVVNLSESDMHMAAAELVEELKSMRADLSG